MRMSGTYQCTGCRLEFTDIDAWRTGADGQIYVDAVNRHLKQRQA